MRYRMVPHREGSVPDDLAALLTNYARKPEGSRPDPPKSKDPQELGSSCRRGRKMLPMTTSEAFSSCSHPGKPGANHHNAWVANFDSRIRQFRRQTLPWCRFWRPCSVL